MYSLSVGDNFTIPEVKAYDNLGDVNVVYTHNINTSTTGEYEIVYTATNSLGTTTYKVKVIVSEDNNKKPIITLLSQIPNQIYAGEKYIVPNATAIDYLGNSIDVLKSDEEILINSVGKYVISYYAIDSEGNETYIEYIINIIENPNGPIVTPGDYLPYYKNVQGLTGMNLKDGLYDILSIRSIPTYGDARYIMEESDLAVGSTDKVYLIYNGDLVKAAWDGSTYNREHVWPKSLLGVGEISNSYKGIASDMHNLRAANPTINSSRGNKPFASGSGEHGAVSGGYYPGDDHIGDVARIILYMHIAWNYEINVGSLNLFLSWHEQDPVDQFERNRNEVIYNTQKNRNPFIDHPEIAQLIWGN